MENEIKNRSHPVHFPLINKHGRPNIVFLTVCSKDRKKIFAMEKIFGLLIQSWEKADYWAVGRFIIMPDHIHLFCSNANYKHPDLSLWINYWKSLVSNKWPFPEEQPIWQQDYWDRQLRKSDNYLRKWEYVRNNPVNHGLVSTSDDWPYQGELNVFQW